MDVPAHQFSHGSLKPIAQRILQTFLLVKMQSRKTIYAAEDLQSKYDMRDKPRRAQGNNKTISLFKKQQELCCNSLYIKKGSKYFLWARIVNVEGLKFDLR